jgi:hypothetical protein
MCFTKPGKGRGRTICLRFSKRTLNGSIMSVVPTQRPGPGRRTKGKHPALLSLLGARRQKEFVKDRRMT